MLKEIVRSAVLREATERVLSFGLRMEGSVYAALGFFIMEGAIVAEEAGLKYNNPL